MHELGEFFANSSSSMRKEINFMKTFNLYHSNTISNNKNNFYPYEVTIQNANNIRQAVIFDHVGAKFTDNKRSNENFIESNVIMMDCDNDHSDNPETWLTPDKIKDFFPDVQFISVGSRNNFKQKGSKSPRPRHHYYFPVDKITNAKKYSELKQKILNVCPLFDKNAADSARLFFGVKNPEIEVHDAMKTVDDFLNLEDDLDFENILEDFENDKTKIHEGNRNNTLFNYALRCLIRLGNSEDTRNLFIEKSQQCTPPLDESEVVEIWKSAYKYYLKIAAEEGYISPDEYNSMQEQKNIKPADFSDVGQAKIFARENQGKLLYSKATGYMFYNGSYWEENELKAQIAVQDLTEKQLADAETEIQKYQAELSKRGLIDKAKPRNEDEVKLIELFKHAQDYKKFVVKHRDSKYISATMKEASPMLGVDIEKFDSDAFLLNMPSGTYNLKTGELQKHNPNDFITKQTAVDISNEGADIWQNALQTIFQGDNELINYVQEIAGMAAIGKIIIEALIICTGRGGNGKSTIWNTIEKVLGSYSGTLSSEVLIVRMNRNVKPEIAELKGKRLIIAPELEEGMRLSESMLKQLCSTDKISAEKKFKDPFSFTPSHQIILYTNPLPRVGSTDDGTWRRIIVIPFKAKFTGRNEIKNFSDYLFENAGGAILKWIVEGTKRFIANDFKLQSPQAVQDAISEYKDDNDWLGHFITDCCDIDISAEIPSKELYENYCVYCNKMNEFARHQKDFNSALQIRGFERKKTNKCNIFKGIKLKTDSEPFS